MSRDIRRSKLVLGGPSLAHFPPEHPKWGGGGPSTGCANDPINPNLRTPSREYLSLKLRRNRPYRLQKG